MKRVRKGSERRTPEAWRVAGWWRMAKQKQTPDS